MQAEVHKKMVPGNRFLPAGLLLLLIGAINSASGQSGWPHAVRDWNDEQFLARVQGVYDWKGSGPDRLQTLEFTEVPINMYQLSTVNRDLDSFPPRDPIDPELKFYPPPKDWEDRESLIANLTGRGEFDTTFFENKLDETAGPDTYFLMGNLYFLKDQFVDAVQHYELAIARYSRFRFAYQNMAFAYINLGDCENALNAVNKAISLGAFGALVKGLQGYCALQNGNYATAVDALAISRMLDTENPLWLELQIQAMIGAGRYGPAKILLGSLADKMLDRTRVYDYLIATAQGEDDSDSLHSLLEIKRATGQLSDEEDTALQRLRASRGIPVPPGDLDNLLIQAETDSAIADTAQLMSELIDYGAWEVASALGSTFIESAIVGFPTEDIARIYYLRANALNALGQTQAAGLQLDELLQSYPVHCEALILRAEIYNKLDQPLLSDDYFNRAIRSSNSCGETARLDYADILIEQEEFSRAFELYQIDRRQKEVAGVIESGVNKKLAEALARLAQASNQ